MERRIYERRDAVKPSGKFVKYFIALSLAFGASTGCESTGGGNVSGSVYYGTGFYDPWYYGGYDNDVIVVPPSPDDRPDDGLRPSHPIALPPEAARPSPRPTPSIPSTPRPSFRRR
jgi:hypothetical protein